MNLKGCIMCQDGHVKGIFVQSIRHPVSVMCPSAGKTTLCKMQSNKWHACRILQELRTPQGTSPKCIILEISSQDPAPMCIVSQSPTAMMSPFIHRH